MMSFNPLFVVNFFWFITIFLGLLSSLSNQNPVSGYGQGSGAGAKASTSPVTNTVSRLSSADATSRISSAVQNIISNGGVNKNNLSSVISNIGSMVSVSNPGLIGDEVLVQTLLEVVSALVHVLSSSSIESVDAVGQSSSSATGIKNGIKGK
ncbi:spidroin-1-like [Panonychus citri]|uniref:spidroin-1-like n=1 Tax=Panonychus citri TaxID=50023 RepID=UPI002307745E|nr:spidroin-1-like [Panonychus citri]